MSDFSGTNFDHHSARFKREFTVDFQRLVDDFLATSAERKEDLPWVKLAIFGHLKTERGSLRHDANVVAITGVEGDYDAEKVSFDEARELLRNARVAAMLYTSPSHAPEHPRWRVLCPFGERLPPGERAKLVARLNGVLGGVLAGESFTLSQAYYFGHLNSGHERAAFVEGDRLQHRHDLDDGAIGKSGKKPSSDGDGEYHDHVGLDELIERILDGSSLHPSVAAIAGKMAKDGVPRQACIDIVGGAFHAAKQDRYGARWKECLEAIDWVYDKEENKQRQAAGAAPLPPDIVFEDFYAYLPKHWYLYVPTQTLWPAATINARLAKKDGLKAARWLDKFRAVSQMIWAPGEKRIVANKHMIEGGWIAKPGAIVFNQYHQPALTGGNPAAAKPWLDLVRKLYPKPLEHEHIIKTLAFKLQHPATKINHALVLGGGMRIGKDTMLVPIKRALGPWNCVEARPTTIMSNFNGYMRSVLLLINETRDLGDVKRHEFYDHMKNVIVSPPETVLVNEKHEKAIHVLNVCLVVMTTNHRTDGLYLPPGDGRHFPVWSELRREDYEPDFFRNHYDWLNDDGAAHVAAYLRALDVSGFRHADPPPLTDLFHEIVDQSTPLEVTWLSEIIDDMGRPAVFILLSLTNRAQGEVKTWLENPATRKIVGHRLEDCGYIRVRNHSNSLGLWRVDGRYQMIYGRKDLDESTRQSSARSLG